MSETVRDLRTDYSQNQGLRKDNLSNDPVGQFDTWMKEAMDSDMNDPNAFTLSTITVNQRPASRILLLRGYGEDGFVFFTNYYSQKVQELRFNPYACINFFWPEMQRQVRIEGVIEKISKEESDSYFHSRPRESQIGAWASPQSAPIPNRELLDDRVEMLEKKFEGKEIPRPDHWGGMALKPDSFEFWQGRANRLHDRFMYIRDKKGNWKIERLAP